ncbi:hypothetical protein LWI28_010137 [Acer negundo]|uniref:Uncharacterized protein n=1 Tax=Acer negundo TaxID=4023 RepID=A0AAD5P025_ACENE|nr:hypothetical protein LWI28_010137 [Acer negundo]
MNQEGADACSFIEVLDPGVDGPFRDKDLRDWDWGDQIDEIEDGSELAEEDIEDLQVFMVSVAKDPPPKLQLKELPTTLKYVYLDENETYPVIVASELKVNEEERLMEWTNVPHLDHGLTKSIKELSQATSKAVNDGNSISTSGGEQFLIGLEKAAVVLEIGEVVVVESVRSGWIKASHDPAALAILELHHLHSPSPVELTVLQSSPRPAPALVPPPISVSGPAPQQALPAVSDPSSAAPPAPLTLPDPDSAAAAPPDLEPSSVDPLALPAELPSSTAPLPSSPPLHGHHMITRLRDGVKQPKIRTDGTRLDQGNSDEGFANMWHLNQHQGYHCHQNRIGGLGTLYNELVRRSQPDPHLVVEAHGGRLQSEIHRKTHDAPVKAPKEKRIDLEDHDVSASKRRHARGKAKVGEETTT